MKNNSVPVYRFRENLAPATVGERKMRRASTLFCGGLSLDEQRKLCQERIVRLRQLKAFLVDEDDFLAELQQIEEAIALELSWESQLLNAPIKKKAHKVASYPGLLPHEIERISKIATTPKGVIYAKYMTSRVRGCNFVSRAKLTAAITEIKKLKIEKVWATKSGGLGVKDEEGACFEFGIEEIAPLLVEWNNKSFPDGTQPMTTTALPSSFVQYKLKKEAIEFLLKHQFTHVSVEDEGEIFLRIKRNLNFYGVIVINQAGEINYQPGTPGAQLTFAPDVATAVEGLVSAFAPPVVMAPSAPSTISQTEWDNLKAIAKSGNLTTAETLAIVLDAKYLRPLNLGEVASPRMVLAIHYPEIKRRLSALAAECIAATSKLEVFPQASDRQEYSRIESLYPRLFARLRGLVDATLQYGLTLREVEVQPFSIAIASASHEVLGKVTVNVEGFLIQVQGQFKAYATATEMLAELTQGVTSQRQTQ